jgi:Fe-S cluster biogenesis protein NfuA
MLLRDQELAEHATQLETLLQEIESFPNPDQRAKMTSVVQSLVTLYGEGLARMLEIVERQDNFVAGAVFAAFAADDLVSHLLVLHDLHPIPVHDRVARALDEVRPYLESHGGNVEFLGIDDGIVRLRLQGSCNGCPSSTITLKSAIEEAIRKAAPELEGIDAEGVTAPPPPPPGFVPAASVRRYTQCPAGIDSPKGGRSTSPLSLNGAPA